MASIDYPTLSDPVSIGRKKVKKQNRTPFEDGSVQSRPRYTRSRIQLELQYENIDYTEITTMETFFEANQGSLFNFTDPVFGGTKDFRFTGDEIESDIQSPTKCSMVVSIEEA